MTTVDRSTDDHLLWLNALRGKGNVGTPKPIKLEADLMRQLAIEHHDHHSVLAAIADANASSTLSTERNWQIVLARLRADADADLRAAAQAQGQRNRSRQQATQAGQRSNRANPNNRSDTTASSTKSGSALSALIGLSTATRAALVAALLLILGVLWQQWQNHQVNTATTESTNEPQYRGNETAQRIKTVNPAEFADHVAQILKANNIPLRRVELTDAQGKSTGAIQLQAKVEPGSAAVGALVAVGVKVPEAGRMDLVISVQSR